MAKVNERIMKWRNNEIMANGGGANEDSSIINQGKRNENNREEEENNEIMKAKQNKSAENGHVAWRRNINGVINNGGIRQKWRNESEISIIEMAKAKMKWRQ
jgi:hypothetical protein